MTNSELYKMLKKKNIIIRGFGVIGEYLYHILNQEKNTKDILVCDRNSKEKKEIDEVGNVRTISFEEAIRKAKDYIFVIASYYSKDVMVKELREAGISDDRIIYGVTDEAWGFYVKEEEKRKRTPLTELQFEIDVTMHCNLDCNCCSQFGAIAQKEFADITSMERDFKRLSELFDGKAKRIYLIGGEPLLNPEIDRCMDISRNYFKEAKIDIFTNGLLLSRMSMTFWDTCRRRDIGIIVTKYPVKADYERMRTLADENGVKFEFFGASEDFKYMTPLGLDIHGKQDVNESFALCSEANNCIKLKAGRLYTCTRPAAIYKFNTFFGTNLEVLETDSINIYEAKNSKEILEFMSHPISFCRYCDNRSHKEAREWCHSKKVMEEWT